MPSPRHNAADDASSSGPADNSNSKMNPRRQGQHSDAGALSLGGGASTTAAEYDDNCNLPSAAAPPEIQIMYEDEQPGDSTFSSRRRRDRQPRRAAEHEHTMPHANNYNNNNDRPEEPASVSFPDQLAASALSGTIEFLKVAGGLTLNATGKVVAPPLHVTRTVLLPALWAAAVDYLSASTPIRAKDWFRILSSSVGHVTTVLKETERGQVFRQRLLLLGSDLLDCLSADTTRQVLVDGMAGFVKFIEALNTPETKAFLDQFTVLCCRLTQVAASGRSQKALHDAKTLAWSGVELLADPSSTAAFAEVTAYLCHALEMEDALLSGAFLMETNRPQRANRRRERDDYQRDTFQNKTTLLSHNPNVTVEQVILSSLGSASTADIATESDGAYHTSSGQPPPSPHVNQSGGWQSESGSLRQQVDEASSVMQTATTTSVVGEEGEEQWTDQAQSNVNVQVLRHEISKRAERLSSRRNDGDDIPHSIPAVTTVQDDHDDDDGNSDSPQTRERRSATVGDVGRATPAMDGDEDALDRFYRVLDNVMKEKRAEGIDYILAEYADSVDKVLCEGKVHKPKQDNHDQELLAQTIKSRMTAIRADINKGLDKDDREKLKQMEAMIKRNSWVVYLGIATVVGVILLWIALGFYGMYVLVFPSVAATATSSAPPQEVQRVPAPLPPPPRPFQYENEVVIRLVREVVHTDSRGFVLDRTPEQTQLSRERIEKISACISESVESSSEEG